MSSAKRAFVRVVRAWLAGEGAAPRVLRRCDACDDERWCGLGKLARRARRVVPNAWLPDGRRADVVLFDGAGRVILVVQLAGGTRLRDRSEGAGAPLLVLDAGALLADPARFIPVRQRGLPRFGCRCDKARALPVEDGFSLRVVGCPLNLRRPQQNDSGATAQASVVHDCGRCSFFVGIGYADAARRRVSLYCAFGTPAQLRMGPRPSPVVRLAFAPPPAPAASAAGL